MPLLTLGNQKKPAVESYYNDNKDGEMMRIVNQIRKRADLPDLKPDMTSCTVDSEDTSSTVDADPYVLYTSEGEAIPFYTVEVQTDTRSKNNEVARRCVYNDVLEKNVGEELQLVKYRCANETQIQTSKAIPSYNVEVQTDSPILGLPRSKNSDLPKRFIYSKIHKKYYFEELSLVGHETPMPLSESRAKTLLKQRLGRKLTVITSRTADEDGHYSPGSFNSTSSCSPRTSVFADLFSDICAPDFSFASKATIKNDKHNSSMKVSTFIDDVLGHVMGDWDGESWAGSSIMEGYGYNDGDNSLAGASVVAVDHFESGDDNDSITSMATEYCERPIGVTMQTPVVRGKTNSVDDRAGSFWDRLFGKMQKKEMTHKLDNDDCWSTGSVGDLSRMLLSPEGRFKSLIDATNVTCGGNLDRIMLTVVQLEEEKFNESMQEDDDESTDLWI